MLVGGNNTPPRNPRPAPQDASPEHEDGHLDDEEGQPLSKKALAAGIAAIVVGGLIIMNLMAPEPEPEKVVIVDPVKPTLQVGEADLYERSFIEDFQVQVDDDTDKLLRKLAGQNASLMRSFGTRPPWIGDYGVAWEAVPSTGHLLIAGGAVHYDDIPKPDSKSWEIGGDEKEGKEAAKDEESGVAGKIEGKLTGMAKGALGGGMISNAVIDGAAGMAKSKLGAMTGQ